MNEGLENVCQIFKQTFPFAMLIWHLRSCHTSTRKFMTQAIASRFCSSSACVALFSCSLRIASDHTHTIVYYMYFHLIFCIVFLVYIFFIFYYYFPLYFFSTLLCCIIFFTYYFALFSFLLLILVINVSFFHLTFHLTSIIHCYWCLIQSRSVEKVAILFANPKGVKTNFLFFALVWPQKNRYAMFRQRYFTLVWPSLSLVFYGR